MELEVTWRRSFRFWWAIWWRSKIVETVVWPVAAIVVGILVYFLSALFKVDLIIEVAFIAIYYVIILVICKIYVQNQFIIENKISDFVTIMVDPDVYAIQQDKISPLLLFVYPPRRVNLTRSFRLWWEIYWRSSIIELLFWVPICLVIIVVLFMTTGNLEYAFPIMVVSYKFFGFFVSAYSEIYVQRRFIMNKVISDFVPVMLDPAQYQPQQEKNLPPPTPPLPRFEHPLTGGL